MIERIAILAFIGLTLAFVACAAPQQATSSPTPTTATDVMHDSSQTELQQMRSSEGVTTDGELLVIVGCHVALSQDTGRQFAEAKAFNALLGTCPSGKATTMGIQHRGFIWADGMACIKMTMPKIGFVCQQ